MSIVFEGEEQNRKQLTCYCKDHCPEGEYGTCHTKPGGKCFTSVELRIGQDNEVEQKLSYGCLPPNGMVDFYCRSRLISTAQKNIMKCCDTYDNCNKHLLPVINVKKPTGPIPWDTKTLRVLISSIAVSLVVFIAISLAVYFRYRHKEKKHKKKKEQNKEINKNDITITDTTYLEKEISDRVVECSQSSTSLDFAVMGVVQRTVSKQIQMDLKIASGKYGETWIGSWRGEKVAVKMYVKRYEDEWKWEAKTYQTVLMRHENILGYIASDITGTGPSSKFLTVTQYHELGSLRSYLKRNKLNPTDLLKLARSLARGLCYLHLEISGCKGKPAIAHNNLTSKSILVKADKECCVGDFTKAAKYDNSQNKIHVPEDYYNNEFRYLAPEILAETFDARNFESFKMSDVYSFSLVLWEMANRCEIEDLVAGTSYKLPYEDTVSNKEKTWSAIYSIVKESKPEINQKWLNDPILKVITKLLDESWNVNPSARHTILRIKKTLLKLSRDSL